MVMNDTINEWDDEDVFPSAARESTRLYDGIPAGTGQIIEHVTLL